MKSGGNNRDIRSRYRVMAFFLVTGLLAVGIGSSMHSKTLGRGVLSLHVVSDNTGPSRESFKVSETDARQISCPTAFIPGPTLGGFLENTQLVQVITPGPADGLFGIVSPTNILDENPYSFPTPPKTTPVDIVETLNFHYDSSSLPSPHDLSHQSFSLGNKTLESYRSSRQRLRKVPISDLQLGYLLVLLAATALVLIGFPVLFVVDFRFKRTFLKSLFDFNLCEELENIVPAFLLRNGHVPIDNDSNTRFVPPLGYVILTEAGTCSIDPSLNRQITEEEDKNRNKFGDPVDALSYPRSPLAPLTSCIAGSRPESPISQVPRKVTFADENEIILFPCLNVTRERNIRRRLSRRLGSPVAANDTGKHNGSGGKRR